MKRIILIVSALGLSLLAYSESNESNLNTIEKRHLMMMKTFGGMIVRENSARGSIVFINTQSNVSEKELNILADKIRNAYNLTVKIQKGTGADADISSAKLKYGMMRIVITEKKNMPTFLVAPDALWACVNVEALNRDNPTPDILAKRVRGEAVRAFAILSGACDSINIRSLFVPILTPKNLDAAVYDMVPPELEGRFRSHLNAYGICGYEKTTYLNACRRGWAPAPTNEYQKAIWDKVRSDKERGPTNPIEIPMPKKK
jgi:hypothetical protein